MNSGLRILILALFGLLPAAPTFADPPPLAAYGNIPAATGVRMSPDGSALAMIGAVNGRPTVTVWPLDGRPPVAVPSEFEPTWVAWKNNNRLVFSIRFMSNRLVGAGRQSEPTTETRLIAINADGTNPVRMGNTNKSKMNAFGGGDSQFQDRVVSLLKDDPDNILMALPRTDPLNPDVEKFSIATGNFTGGFPHVAGAEFWMADPAGAVRLVRVEGGEFRVRDSDDGEWRTIRQIDLGHDQSATNHGGLFKPIAIEKAPSALLYVVSDHEGGVPALYEFDTKSVTFGKVVARATPEGMEPIVVNNQFIGYVGPGQKPVYLDSDWAADYAVVEKALANRSNLLVDRSTDGKRVLIASHAPNQPWEYWLLDRTGPKPALSALIQTYPAIPANAVAPLRLTSYRARDGLNIPALVTLPVGRGDGPFPFVVLPHDGPRMRDVPYLFDYFVQFLVSRGYGVLQPQFRGSTGFGSAFEQAGNAQWGLAMQDDVADGTRWIIEQKFADPARICIVGRGYGGYAALMGAIRDPSLFRCVGAIAPQTDLAVWKRRFRFQTDYQERLDPNFDSFLESDFGQLAELSPARNAAKINVPVLLVHGRNDTFVPVKHSEDMEQALKAAGKPVETLYLDNADHEFSFGSDRRAMLDAVQRLLQANLGAAAP